MIKAVIFDMDGTLTDTERVYVRAWRGAGEELKLDCIETVLRDCTGRSAGDIRKYFDEKLDGVISYDEFYPVRERHYEEIVTREGVTLKSGVAELLKNLAERGVRMAIATSTKPDRTWFNLRATGLARFFTPETVVTGNLVERGKPAPDIFLLAAKRLGVAPSECIGVEDSFNGVRAIHAAGMFTVMVPDTVMPTEEIRSLLDAECGNIMEVLNLIK